MIDLHTHFLPKVDDGSASVAESMAMLTDSYEQGVELCVATPHCVVHKNEDITVFCDKRKQRFLELGITKTHDHIPEILLGAEVYLDCDISRYPDIRKLCIGDTNLLLVEFPVVGQSAHIGDWLYSLTMEGIRPIIAHIDRYPNRMALIESFEGIDLIYQINASRFLSFRGRKRVRQLLKTRKTFVVSSDMHNMTKRKNRMQEAYLVSKRKLFDAPELFYQSAMRVLEK